MSLQTLFVDSHLNVAYDHAHEWLCAEWQGGQDLHSIQQGAEQIVQLLHNHRSHKLLNDNTGLVNMWSEAAEWGGKEWLPAMTAAGLHYLAWVYSPDVYSRLSTDLLLQYDAGNAIIATFYDRETATAWLERV